MTERKNFVSFGLRPSAEERRELEGFLQSPKPGNDSGDSLRDRLARVWHSSGDLADDPEILALRRKALAGSRMRSASRGLGWWALGGMAAAIALLVVAVPMLVRAPHPFSPLGKSARDSANIVASGPGQRTDMVLADGTKVTLDGRTRIRVAITESERRIELIEGRALFDVTHEERPFRVYSAGGETLDLGTKFLIDTDGKSATVTLIEGKVRITPGNGRQPEELKPGELLRYGAGRSTVPPSAASADPLGWTVGRLTFEDTPLAEALATLSRYSPQPVTADSAVMRERRLVTGTFIAANHEDAVKAIATALGLRIETREDGARILHN